jgi:transposase
VLLLFGFVITELSVMEQRYQAVLEVGAGIPVVEVAQRFGVSRLWGSRTRRMVSDQRFQAATPYWLIRPPRIG